MEFHFKTVRENFPFLNRISPISNPYSATPRVVGGDLSDAAWFAFSKNRIILDELSVHDRVERKIHCHFHELSLRFVSCSRMARRL